MEQLDSMNFRTRPPAREEARTFGGEVFAQAVVASCRTVPADRAIHSAHGHFLRAGDPAAPVHYRAAVVRDGRSFSVRTVEAVQHGRTVLLLTASFHVPEPGFSHQALLPDGPAPEQLPSARSAFAASHPVDRAWLEDLQQRRSLEFRFPEELPRLAARRGERRSPRQRVWLRTTDTLAQDRVTQTGALAYVSDALLLSTALAPHSGIMTEGGLSFASLDHTMWFHAPHRLDEWLLYEQESDWAGGGRALCQGRMYDLEGRLLATVAQEGLLRPST
ncbi:acyl-CoA thioesterase [Streptomyces sp. NPDC088746]|uniref:acyl-CoA thioesterase n=1 Tax=Streptomyces sp. NPDC088746 TaxID=3365885 RepID=UPI0038279912